MGLLIGLAAQATNVMSKNTTCLTRPATMHVASNGDFTMGAAKVIVSDYRNHTRRVILGKMTPNCSRQISCMLIFLWLQLSFCIRNGLIGGDYLEFPQQFLRPRLFPNL